MQLYYFKDKDGNFGDDLNPWLWSQLLPGAFDNNASELFVGVGTLLNHRIPKAQRTIVFGSGHGYGDLPTVDQSWHFYSVRGPLTAKALGLSADLAITDPAALVPQFYQTDTAKKFAVSYMPHCDSARLGDWALICQRAGVHFIDPRQGFLEVFQQIQQTELLLTEAMHGAILADAFRVPWIPIKAYAHISEYKWQDWLQSVQIQASFTPLTPVWRGDADEKLAVRLKNSLKRSLVDTVFWQKDWGKPLPAASGERELEKAANELASFAQNIAPNLSSDMVFNANVDKLLEKVRQAKVDFGI